MQKKRIYILGTAGSGKTVLAKEISHAFKIRHYDLDNLFWVRKYDKKRNEKDRKKLLKIICKNKQWVIEGVYASWVDDAIKKSDLVIWLDISRHTITWRIIRRFLKRRQKHKESWKDLITLIKYVRNYRKKDQPAGYYKHKELIDKHKVDFVHIKTKKELNNFIHELIKTPKT